MSGPRILLAVLCFAALLLWAALAGGSDADLARGTAETDKAFAAVEQEIAALDPDYQALRSQGLVLGLREQVDQLRNKLAGLKSRRVQLSTDQSVEKRLRLPLLKDLVEESDVLLALAQQLHRECSALVAWRAQSGPLLAEAGRQRAELAAGTETDDARRARIAALASGLGAIELRVPMVDKLMHDNVDQGTRYGESTLAELRQLVAEQARLLGH